MNINGDLESNKKRDFLIFSSNNLVDKEIF